MEPKNMIVQLAAAFPTPLIIGMLESAIEHYKNSAQTDNDLKRLGIACQMLMTKCVVGNSMEKAHSMLGELQRMEDLRPLIDDPNDLTGE